MKGVILAGGEGTRLYPNTKVTNKHLLPVFNKPMIYYPIENMIKAGIDEILILPGKAHAGDYARLLGSGKDFNVEFTFKVQDHAGGLAYAVGLAEQFVGDDNFLVIFGDNIIDYEFYEDVKNFTGGAQIFCKQVNDPKRFGVAELKGDQVTNIIEKPENPPSDWAVIGAYFYDSKAFEYIKNLKASPRGELEITDLNNVYIQNGNMKASFITSHWYDTGTHASLVEAAYHLLQKDKPAEFMKHDLSKKNSPKIAIGTILYNSYKYLPEFCQSLKKQDYNNIEIYIVDCNDNNNRDLNYIKEHLPEAKILSTGKNIGFARSNNLMAKEALKNNCAFYTALNSDLMIENNYISELLNGILKSPRIAACTGKLKRWNFEQKDSYNKGKTNYIDTTGLKINKQHRFTDRGQGEIDHGQYDKEEEIFGSSGTAVMYRLSCLEDIAYINEEGNKEYFDELMFMYKEDIDLAYRLQRAGYKALYTPNAIAYHDRTIESQGHNIFAIIKNRWKRNKTIKEWSWINHHIILKKMVDKDYSNSVRLKTWWYEFKSFIYILFFEPFLLKQYWQLFKMRNKIKARREQIKNRINITELTEKWMN